MGRNTSAYANQTFARIEGRPEEHEAVIRRHGQYARLIQAKKCPCIKNGKPSLFCNLCNGKGYILSFQEDYEIIDENSPHGCSSLNEVKPFWNPISKVIKIQRAVKDFCGGDQILYDVLNFTDDTITLVDNGSLPKMYEPLKVTYRYRIPEEVLNENSIHDGTFIIHTIETEVEIDAENSNPFNIHGDISSVSRVYNVTQNYTYTVLSFKKQSIILDDNGGAAPIPDVLDVLQVDYEYIKPIKVIVGRVNVVNALTKWGEDLKQGDLECTLAGGHFVKRGNILSLLTSFLNESTVITRGAGTKDEIPQFDVVELVGNILDEDGVEYINDTDFMLSEYNDLIWILNKPIQGKKFTVVYRYHPSYIVYKREVELMNAEDKRFPQTMLLRMFNKFTSKELDIL